MLMVILYLILGSVMTDSVNYTKMLTFNHDGFLAWQLLPGNKSFT